MRASIEAGLTFAYKSAVGTYSTTATNDCEHASFADTHQYISSPGDMFAICAGLAGTDLVSLDTAS